MTEHEIQVEHEGRHYILKVEVEWKEVDDSFDHEWGGRLQTEYLSHYEPEEWEVVSCLDVDTDLEVEPDFVPGLLKAIRWEVEGLEHPDQ